MRELCPSFSIALLSHCCMGRGCSRDRLADVSQRDSAGGVVPLAGEMDCVTHHQAVLVATREVATPVTSWGPVIGLVCVPVGIRQRRVGRAPCPRALRRSIGAANPHLVATRSGEQQRVLRCGLHARQLQARRLAGGVGIAPREAVAH
eukprot:scaffold57491_cov68-Phaeocystis_antarctica.AAC.1